jgi:hypothetical protein
MRGTRVKEDLEIYDILVILFPSTYKPRPLTDENINGGTFAESSEEKGDLNDATPSIIPLPSPPSFDPTLVHKLIDREDFTWYLCRIINSSIWIVEESADAAEVCASPSNEVQTQEQVEQKIEDVTPSDTKIANRMCLWLKGFVRLSLSRTSHPKRGSGKSPGKM